ncbi:hypothetical protein WMW72_12160 [Paenibacillus filicis]|uniref:Phage tail tape measure protein n=1 Tax=Paenibacillus filicis TaxID=669464 RepID=A0ABU9DIG9_9BACL
MIETIKSYLVSLGFSVDKSSYKDATKAVDQVEKSVSKFAGGAVVGFAAATTAVVGFVAASSIAIAKFVGGIAKADLENEKLARQLWISKDAAMAYNSSLKAMGASLEDLYLSPELMRNFQQLNREAQNLKPPAEFAEQMKLVRSVQFEFARMKLEASYAIQWVGYYFVKYMEGPIRNIKTTLQEINAVIVKQMPSWTKVIAQVMSWFARMGLTTFRVIKDIIRLFGDLGASIPKNLKVIGVAVAALGLALKTGPIGLFITALSGLLLLLDDFYTYLDGGQSALGPVWQRIMDFFDMLENSGVIDGFKRRWSEAMSGISEGIEIAYNGLKEFYKGLEDSGAIESFKNSFSNSFEILKKLDAEFDKWIKGLGQKVKDEKVFEGLMTSVASLIGSVWELTEAVTGLLNKLLGLKETEKSLNSIGDILSTTIVKSLRVISDLIGGISGYITLISKTINGDLLDHLGLEGEKADERLKLNPESDKGFVGKSFDAIKNMFSGYFTGNTDFQDAFTRSLGILARSQQVNSGNAPGYTIPQANNQTTKNNVSLTQTNHIHGSDPERTSDAVQDKTESFLMRNFGGVLR